MRQGYQGKDDNKSQLFTGKLMPVTMSETVEVKVTVTVAGMVTGYIHTIMETDDGEKTAAWQVYLNNGPCVVANYDIFPELLKNRAIPEWRVIRAFINQTGQLLAAPADEQP